MSGAIRSAFLTPDNAPDGTACFRLLVPSGDEWEALARGALAPLLDASNWELYGAVTVDEAVEYFTATIFETYRWERCMPIGSVIFWGGEPTALPENWLICDGSPLDQTDYPELFAVIGSTFGTGGPGEFLLPDLIRKFAKGYGIPDAVGDTGGTETVTLTEAQMPAHSHTVNNHSHNYARNTLTGLAQLGAGSLVQLPVQVQTATTGASPGTDSKGSGTAHDNMPPWLALVPLILAK